MNKTLLKGISQKDTYNPTAVKEDTKHNNSGEALIDLIQEMKGYLQNATEDLLQPRPEAVAGLMNRYKGLDMKGSKISK